MQHENMRVHPNVCRVFAAVLKCCTRDTRYTDSSTARTGESDACAIMYASRLADHICDLVRDH